MAQSSSLLDAMTSGLPKEPLEAIAVVAGRVVNKGIADDFTIGTEDDCMAICAFMSRFAKRFGLKIVFPTYSAGVSNRQRLAGYTAAIRGLNITAVEEATSQHIDQKILEYEGSTNVSFGLATLNDEEKKKVHAHIARIRIIVEESDLSDRKKNALFERLTELAREVDMRGTKTDRFFAFAGDAAFVVGEMAAKAKPFLDEVRAMIKVIGRSRARQEGIGLPPGDEALKLPSPEEFEE